jgi:hypothetical protein
MTAQLVKSEEKKDRQFEETLMGQKKNVGPVTLLGFFSLVLDHS